MFMIWMRKIFWILFLILSCTSFNEQFDNIINGGKIRPLGMVLNASQISPGDTLVAQNYFYKPFEVSHSTIWSVALVYDDFGIVIPLADSLYQILGEQNADSLKIIFNKSPNHLIQAVPPNILNFLQVDSSSSFLNLNQFTDDQKALVEILGIDTSSPQSFYSSAFEILDSLDTIPSVLASWVVGTSFSVRLTAKIFTDDFSVQVRKKVAVNYISKLEDNALYLNTKPIVDTIFILQARGDFSDLKSVPNDLRDTFFFNDYLRMSYTGVYPGDVEPYSDVLRVLNGFTYFLFVKKEGKLQEYISPKGDTLEETLKFNWLYTNVDPPGDDWNNYITLTEVVNGISESERGDGGKQGSNIVKLNLPQNKDIFRFHLYLYISDIREGAVSSQSDFVRVSGSLQYF